MKHMILSFNMEGYVISDQFLMLWFQKDSLDTVGFRTFRTFSGEGVAGLGLSPKFYQFFSASLTSGPDWETLAAEMEVAPPHKLLTLLMYTVAYMPILLCGRALWYYGAMAL